MLAFIPFRRCAWLLVLCAACSNAPDAPGGVPSDSALPNPAAPPDSPVAAGAGDTADPVPAPEPPDTASDVRNARWTADVTTTRRNVDGAATLRAVRTARHTGYDRIVFDFGTDPIPGYHIEYIDRPVRQCGSGDTVPLLGDAWLQVRMEPAYAHTDAGQPTIQDRARVPDLPTLLELKLVCDFEAQVEWVGGVRSPAGYRVLELSAPARLVVDLRHGG